MMREFGTKHGHDRKPLKNQRTWNSEIYALAVADTLPARPLRSLRDMAQKRQNEAVISEIQRGLGDTADIAMAVEQAEYEKTISLVTDCRSEEHTKIDVLKGNPPSLISTLPVLEPVALDDAQKKSSLSSVNFNVSGRFERKADHHSIHHQKTKLHPVLSEIIEQMAAVPQNPVTVDIAQMETINLGPDGCIPVGGRSMISELETPIAGNGMRTGGETPRDVSHEIKIGAMVAQRYEILSEISRGGYGVVYRARQQGPDRIVALKRLRANQDKSVMQRFLLEADIIKSLIHPNTIQLIDAGIDEKCQFIVMEYIEGQSLRSLLHTEGRLEILRALHIARQILKSVNEAHQKGIVHRDLKPSNILIRDVIGERDFVKVLDFGIAKARHRTGMRLTQNGKIMGTPQYIAPELLWGEDACPGTDIFAVGLMLAEMVSGKPVLPSDPIQAARLATDTLPIPLPAWVQASEIGDVLMRALEKDPEKRYQTAEAMIDDLECVSARIVGRKQRNDKKKTILGFQPYQFAILATLMMLIQALAIYHFFI